MKKKRFSDIPETADPVLRMIRNFDAFIFDGSVIYPNGLNFQDLDASDVLDWIKNNGTLEQYNEIMKTYNKNIKNDDPFPLQYALSSYSKKHDHVWHDKHQKLYK